MVKAAVPSAMETISAVLAAREGQSLFAIRWWDTDWWVETSQLVFLVGLFLDAISRYIMGNLSIWDASVIANLKDNSMGWTSEGSYKQLATSLCHVISALDFVNGIPRWLQDSCVCNLQNHLATFQQHMWALLAVVWGSWSHVQVSGSWRRKKDPCICILCQWCHGIWNFCYSWLQEWFDL